MPIARPTIEEMQKHYPAAEELSRDELFRSIGWDREIDNMAFLDTCVIRASLGLIGCGVPILGRVQIHKGPFKGKWIEPGQAKLSLWLAKYWGPPEKFKTSEVVNKLSGRCGVISFFNIDPTSPIAQGHIDVLDPTPQQVFQCATKCYPKSEETWFWALPRGTGTLAKRMPRP